MNKLITAFLTVGVLITACGPRATPTIDPAQVQASAVAAASTMIALTQAAIPTATPVPPTDTPSPTPLPSFTPAVLATLPFQAASSPTPLTSSGGGEDDCNHVLDVGEAGPLTRFRITNETTGTVNISLFMAKNAFGQCGYVSASGIAKNSQVNLQVPLGCWSAYAWSTGKINLTTSGYLGCVNNTDLWNVFIRPEAILLKSP
jgi:hypothetical protein